MSLPERTVRDVVEYYESLLEYWQWQLEIPGVQAAVWFDGDVVWSRAYGVADVQTAEPLREDHLFRIASHSKTVTATAILQLVEDGRLGLDDTVAQHVPALAGAPVGARTVRQLLSHSGGIVRDGLDSEYWTFGTTFPDRETLLEIARDPAAAVLGPDERFKYSNIGYGLAGLLIEEVTGTTFAQYVQDRIIKPLGLTDMGPELDERLSRRYSAGHSSLAYAKHRVPIEHIDTRALAPATGCYATARDLVRFFAEFMPGDSTLLTEESKRQMRHPSWSTQADDPARTYGLGLSVMQANNRELFGHGGGYPGHRTRSVADSDRRVVVSVLANAVGCPTDQLAFAFPALLNLAETQQSAGAPTLARDRFSGRFANVLAVRDIATLGGRAFLLDPTSADPAAAATPLRYVDDRTLVSESGDGYEGYGERVVLTRGPDGAAQTVRVPGVGELRRLENFRLFGRVTPGYPYGSSLPRAADLVGLAQRGLGGARSLGVVVPAANRVVGRRGQLGRAPHDRAQHERSKDR